MPLQSLSFRGNARLQQCLLSDPYHVQKGDRGDYVGLIQAALLMLDNSDISSGEQRQLSYGPSTANAVLEHKKKRKIIHYSYQASPDDILGRMTIQSLDPDDIVDRMTIQSLDMEMLAKERAQFHPLCAFLPETAMN